MVKRLVRWFIIAAICIIVCGVIYSVFFIAGSRPPLELLLEESAQQRFPLAVYAYASETDKKTWNSLCADAGIKKMLARFITGIIPLEEIPATIGSISLSPSGPGILIVDYRKKNVLFEQNIVTADQLAAILDDALYFHKTLVESDRRIDEAFENAVTTYNKGRAILAMEQLGTFIALYSDSEHVVEARRMLSKLSRTDAVKEYMEKHREANNRKVLLHQAKEYYTYKRYFNATHALSLLMTNYRGTEEAKEAETLKKQIEQDVRDRFQAANLLYRQKKFNEALDAYLSLNEQLRGTPWQLFVSGKIKELRGDKEYQDYLLEIQRAREVKNLYQKAEKQLIAGQWDIAAQFYTEIIRFYPDSEYTARAKQRILDIEKLRLDAQSTTTTTN